MFGVYCEMENETSDATISTDIKDYDVFLESVAQSEVSIESLKKLTFTYQAKETGEEKEIALSKVAQFQLQSLEAYPDLFP